MKIYLITHPDTVVDRDLRPEKWKISRDGWSQVRNLSKKKFWDEISFIFASVEPKANLAARYWSEKHGIPMAIFRGIEEIRNRQYVPKRKLLKVADAFYSHPEKNSGTWETADHCLKRMKKSFKKILEQSKKRNCSAIAVVSHGAVSNLYVCDMRKIPASAAKGQKKIGSWIVIDAKKRKVVSKWHAY